MNRAAVRHHRARREQRTWWLVHERHELVWETRHRATDANTSNVWAAADSSHPSALSDIALHHRTPAAQLHNAGRRSIFFRELGLLVIAPAIASFVHRCSKEPCRTQGIVQRNHRGSLRRHVEQIE